MLKDTLEVMYTFFLTVYVGELNSLGRRLAICYNCIESNLNQVVWVKAQLLILPG